MAEALYRKYRPQVFEDVVGQESIERTLKNAVVQDKVSHAYLFTGPRGTGKTTTARLLAKALLCQTGPTDQPDGTCEDCALIAEGIHPDVYELDAASRTGVENVREEIIGRVHYAPTRGRYKVYIIDEVHMLSTAAFNALLKTLEEPPSHVVFILATTDPQKVPETIHSRCQRFDFRRISAQAIAGRLGAICESEGVTWENDALDLIAHRADGAMRNALTSLEQLIAFGEGNVSMEIAESMLGGVSAGDVSELVEAIGRRDGAACFRWVAALAENGGDMAGLAGQLAARARDLYVMGLGGADTALNVSAAERRQLADELPLFPLDRSAHVLAVLGDAMRDLKTAADARLTLEIALTRMVRPETDITLEGLAARVGALEAGKGVTPQPAPPQGQPVMPAYAAPSPAYGAPSQTTPESTFAPVPQGFPVEGVPAPQRTSQSAPVEATPTPRDSAAEAVPAPQGSPVKVTPVPVSAAETRPVTTTATAEPPLATLQNPAALQRLWQGVLGDMRRVKPSLGVLFLGTKAVFDPTTNGLIIEFPATNDFAFKAAQKPDVQNELTAALRQQTGCDLAHRLIKAAGLPTDAPASQTFAVDSTPTSSGSFAAFTPAYDQAKPTTAWTAESAGSAVAQPTPAPLTQTPEPYHEDVPLEAYDAADTPPWQEAPSYAADSQPSSETPAVSPVTTQVPPSATPVTAETPSPTSMVSDPSQGAAHGTDMSADDLQSMLNASWGGGVVVQQVD